MKASSEVTGAGLGSATAPGDGPEGMGEARRLLLLLALRCSRRGRHLGLLGRSVARLF